MANWRDALQQAVFCEDKTKATSLYLDFSVIVHIICIMGVAQIAFPILEFQLNLPPTPPFAMVLVLGLDAPDGQNQMMPKLNRLWYVQTAHSLGSPAYEYPTQHKMVIIAQSPCHSMIGQNYDNEGPLLSPP